jgi:hypothetical protein
MSIVRLAADDVDLGTMFWRLVAIAFLKGEIAALPNTRLPERAPARASPNMGIGIV